MTFSYTRAIQIKQEDVGTVDDLIEDKGPGRARRAIVCYSSKPTDFLKRKFIPYRRIPYERIDCNTHPSRRARGLQSRSRLTSRFANVRFSGLSMIGAGRTGVLNLRGALSKTGRWRMEDHVEMRRCLVLGLWSSYGMLLAFLVLVPR